MNELHCGIDYRCDSTTIGVIDEAGKGRLKIDKKSLSELNAARQALLTFHACWLGIKLKEYFNYEP